MAGLETVVRPVVFPIIRPTPASSVAPKADPKQGKAVITGSSGKTIDLPYSVSINSSQTRKIEHRRRVDTARVYQMDDDGNVNKENFVDIKVANKIWHGDAGFGQPNLVNSLTPVSPTQHVEVLQRNEIITNPLLGGTRPPQ